MSFADDLKAAGESAQAVSHEFRANHSGSESRVHAFVEGYEDRLFYQRSLEAFAGNRKLYFYTCHGKQKVYAAFADVTSHVGNYRHTVFFVDKDLEDILPERYAHDKRIYTTDWYSIENYITSSQLLTYVLSNFCTQKKCNIPLEPVLKRFERSLEQFYFHILPIMAWVVALRRKGMRPLLDSVELKKLFEFDDDLNVRPKRGRMGVLSAMTKIADGSVSQRELRTISHELRRLSPKSYVRGKFETWFFVEFAKKAIVHLKEAAKQHGGNLDIPVNLERGNVIALLSPVVPLPPSIDRFLRDLS